MVSLPNLIYHCGVAYLRCRDDLSTTALALRSALNDTRQIENLNFRTSILEHTRNGSERGERVGCNFGLGLGDLRKESRFTNRGEAD